MAGSSSDIRTGRTHQVLETMTATVQFTGYVVQGEDSTSDSGSDEVADPDGVSPEHGAGSQMPVKTSQHSSGQANQAVNDGRSSDDALQSQDGGTDMSTCTGDAGDSQRARTTTGEPCSNMPPGDTEEDNSSASFTHPVRFNPFLEEDYDERDPFSHVNNDAVQDDILTCGSHEDPQLPIKEDYFAQPEDHISLASIEDLEKAIEACKKEVLSAASRSDNKKNLTHRLIQLRLKLAEAKEKSQSEEEEGVKAITGHLFVMKESQTSRRYCEQCNTAIWGVVQTWYRCKNCGFCCHEKCLNLIRRTCAYVKVQNCPEYILSICPEKTLASQNYQCNECRTEISFHASQHEPRLCDYTGFWYCSQCHWNDHAVIPARVLHNWDFETRKVCRASKQFLKLMQRRAVLRVADINPMLFNFVDELSEIKKLREEILIMKQYFLSCRGALKSKLLLQLKDRQHFVDNSDMYSLNDLFDVAADVLLPELVKIHASFAQHIKTDCPFCQAKGAVCNLCDEKELVFPFDSIAIVCSDCSSILHRHCYMSSNQRCPNCSLTIRSEY